MTTPPLVFILLALNPWVGVWRVQLTDMVQPATHIFVHPDYSVELYEPNWSQMYLINAEFLGDKLQLDCQADSGLQSVRLEVKLNGPKSFAGKTEIRIGGGQFPAEAPVTGVKVLSYAAPEPPAWIKASRAPDVARVDILGLLVRQAPRDSFEEFVEFWDQQVEPKYYIYMHDVLYGLSNNPEVRLTCLKALFSKLPQYQPDQLAELESRAVAALDPRVGRAVRNAKCRVVLPAFGDEQPRIEPIAVVKVPYPEGQRPCCSFKNFKAEFFLFLPLRPAAPQGP